MLGYVQDNMSGQVCRSGQINRPHSQIWDNGRQFFKFYRAAILNNFFILMYDWATNVLPHHPIVMLGKECRMTRTQSKWFVPHPMLPWGCLNEKCPTAPVIRVYLMCKLLWGQLIATFCLLIVCQSACYSKVILEVGFYVQVVIGCKWK